MILSVQSNSRSRLTWSDRSYVIRRSIASFWMNVGIDAGAKLTFFTVLAFAPTLLSVYSLSTLVLANNRELIEQVTNDFIESYVLDGYEDLVRDIVDMVVGSQTGGVIGLIVSVVISLLSASAYVRAFARTANDAYGITEGRNVIRVWLWMMLVTAVLVVGVILILVALTVNELLVNSVLVPLAAPLGLEGIVEWMTDQFMPVWTWVRWPFIAVLAVLLIDVLYHFTPNLKLPKFRWLSAGSMTAVVGLVIVGSLLGVYLLHFTGLSSYGALGTVLAVLFALWGANIVLVIGLIVDVETLRVHQLRRGAEAEQEFQLPLRSSGGVEFQERVHGRLVDRGREIRDGRDAHDEDEQAQ